MKMKCGICHIFLKMLLRARQHGSQFDAALLRKFEKMLDCVDMAYKAMLENLSKPYDELKDISNAQLAEDSINAYRNTLREEHIGSIEKSNYNYQTGVLFMDIVNELERVGDFIINISQAQLLENTA